MGGGGGGERRIDFCLGRGDARLNATDKTKK